MDNSETIQKYLNEIQTKEADIRKLKKLIPFGILTCMLAPFVLAFVPLGSGLNRKSLAEHVSYPIAVIIWFLTFSITYVIFLNQALEKKKLEIKRRKSWIEQIKNS